MIEKGFTPEIAMQVAQSTLGLCIFAMAFRKEIRLEVRRRQGNVCDSCGQKVDKLQTHHRRPESLGGASSRIENAVGLCPDCHQEIDRETFGGQQYPQVHTREQYYPQGNGLG